MSKIDARAQDEYAIPGQVLMENAGIKAHTVCRDLFEEFSDTASGLLYLAGSGNNGGDALVMARQAFTDGMTPKVILAGPVKSTSAAANLVIAEKLGIPVVSYIDQREESVRLLGSADLIVDGLFGTGVSGPLRGEAAGLVDDVNASKARVVSIDLPSGLGDGFKPGHPVIKADVTLCLGLPKECLYLPSARPGCGQIIHLPIGFPPDLTRDDAIPGELLEYDDIDMLSGDLPPDAHKGTRGKLGVFAGSVGMTGAPVLACRSAARSGCGLVTLLIDEDAYLPAASHLVSVMPKPWSASGDPAAFDFTAFDAILAGPGWGFENRLPWLRAMIGSKQSCVLDADALTLLAGFDSPPDFGGNAVLTPHPGEMARLADATIREVIDDPFGYAARTAGSYNAVVVLKGHVTTICGPNGRYRLFDGMNPALGTGGSGDVLAGIIAGLAAGGTEIFDAASLGVLVHAMAAKRAFDKHGWFLAEDLPPYISRILAGDR